jgi:hypothetical protein
MVKFIEYILFNKIFNIILINNLIFITYLYRELFSIYLVINQILEYFVNFTENSSNNVQNLKILIIYLLIICWYGLSNLLALYITSDYIN